VGPFAEEIGEVSRQRRECSIESLPRTHPFANAGDIGRAQTDPKRTQLSDRNGLADLENAVRYAGDIRLQRRSQGVLDCVGGQRHAMTIIRDDRKYRPAPELPFPVIAIDQIETKRG
jgi:hypothetical protein